MTTTKPIIAAIVLVSMAMTAADTAAQTNAPDHGCFHVSFASQSTSPVVTPIKWNSCTGETWILLKRVFVNDKPKDGDPSGSPWSWEVIPTDPKQSGQPPIPLLNLPNANNG